MEKEKTGKGKNIVIVILILIILSLAGYLIYNQLMNKKEQKKENIQVSEKESSNFDLKNKSEIQTLEASDGYYIIIAKDGTVYLNVSEINDSETSVFDNLLKKQYQEYEIEDYCTDISCPNGNKIQAVKLNVDNVVSAYKVINGQSPELYEIYFIKTDGTLSKINLGQIIYNATEQNNLNLEIENNINNLTNIVAITQSQSAITMESSGYHYAIAIEKDGTTHNLNN